MLPIFSQIGWLWFVRPLNPRGWWVQQLCLKPLGHDFFL